MRAVCLWSGGKDSCFAYYKAREQGHLVVSLFNFMNMDKKLSLTHGISSEVILRQAQAIGSPMTQKVMPWKGYRDEFKTLITSWKRDAGIDGIVFGDIYLQEHKDWIDRVCEELQVSAIMPLWGENTETIVREFIELGFEAIITTTKADLLGQEWLGRKIDSEFLDELEDGIDPCGEKGEFHTFVYNGPVFRKPLNYEAGKKELRGEHWFLEICSKC